MASDKDIAVGDVFNDSVSFLRFSPRGMGDGVTNWLVGGSWNGEVRVWEVGGRVSGKAGIKHGMPALCGSWKHDGSVIFSGGGDCAISAWDLGSNKQSVVARHEDPIRFARWIGELNVLCTAGWDKRICFWDPRSPPSSPASVQSVGERVYAMDVAHPLLVAGLAGRRVLLYNLSGDVSRPYAEHKSKLNFQTRSVCAFDGPERAHGYVLGSASGECDIRSVSPGGGGGGREFTFKAHMRMGKSKRPNQLYSVTSISFHPIHGTLATTGSDGNFHFWDKNARKKLRNFPPKTKQGRIVTLGRPVVCGTFNKDGSIYAYACSYMWENGLDGYPSSGDSPAIYLHPVSEEATPRRG